MRQLLPSEERLLVLLVPDVLFDRVLFHPFRFFGALLVLSKDGVHLRPQTDALSDRRAGHLVLHLSQYFLVFLQVEGMVPRVVARVKQRCVLLHVHVDVLRFHLDQEVVRVRVDQIAPLAVLSLQKAVIEVVHQDLALFQHCYPDIHWLVESCIVHVHPVSLSMKKTCCEYNGLATIFLMLPWSLLFTNFMSVLFRRSSIVFPNTELFVSAPG